MNKTYFTIRIETKEKLTSENKLKLLSIFRKQIKNVVPNDMKAFISARPSNEEIMKTISKKDKLDT